MPDFRVVPSVKAMVVLLCSHNIMYKENQTLRKVQLSCELTLPLPGILRVSEERMEEWIVLLESNM